MAANTTVQMQTPAVTQKTGKILPFRQATVERCDTLPEESGTIAANLQNIIRDIQGDGFMYSIGLELVATAAGNAAAVAFAEDAPFNAINSPILKDVNGDLVNLRDGFELLLCNLAMADYLGSGPTGTSLYSTVTGAVANGGSFSAFLKLPVGINRRDLIGIVGNQDRAQKYQLRTNIADSGSIYTVAPTALPDYVLRKFYENYSVPLSRSADGTAQQQTPDKYGVLHELSSSVDQTAPSAGSKNHYLSRIGNTLRYIILVFRQGSGATPRAAAHGFMNDPASPANIQVKVGSDTLFNETYRYRRYKMYERYGFDWPSGVLVYDTMHDFGRGAGAELGNDWYHTAGITNFQFIVNYPASFVADAANELVVITDDLLGI